VCPKIFDDVISRVKILLRIQPWYFGHQAASGSGDIQDRVPCPKWGVATNIRSRHFLCQNFTANPAMLLSSPGDFRFRRYPGEGSRSKRGCGQKYSITSFPELEFYCESNHGVLVTRRLLVSEISRIGFHVQKGVCPKIFHDVISRVKIILRIQSWYVCDQACSGPGDSEAAQKGRGP
jgi:hypothetical protein